MARIGRKLLLIAALGVGLYLAAGLLPRGRNQVPAAELERLAIEMETRFHIDRSLILAVVEHESGGDAWAQSAAGAQGLMQLMPATGADLARRYNLSGDLRDPAANMALGCAYLRELGDRFGDQPDLVLAAYHAGPTRVQGWQRAQPRLSVTDVIAANAGPQTRAYVANVKATWLHNRQSRTKATERLTLAR